MPTTTHTMRTLIITLLAGATTLLAGCAATGDRAAGAPSANSITAAQLPAAVNRVSWGINQGTWQQAQTLGYDAWLEQQLRPAPALLPAAAQAQIDGLTITTKPLRQLVTELEQQREDAEKIADDDEKKAAKKVLQVALNEVARETATRSLLRDLYSPNQLQEQMTWFWMNHFNIFTGKSYLRLLVGDYEENAIRPHALGKFRDLLGATLYHPAMIRYLDNDRNAARRINENYARELMELHTLGVDGGYSQRDVQELARILTGVGVNLTGDEPKVKQELQSQYVRNGLFEFNPERHDYGNKQFLGQAIKGRGLAEVDEALDRLARNPATARFISHKLAVYFVADEPPPALVARMAAVFQSSDGDIAAVLRTMLTSTEFAQSLGKKFKDPVHYVISAVRLTYDDKVVLNTAPMVAWINRMAQPLYGRQTPDGYALTQPGWASPGQMTTRFEIAKTIGSGNPGLFKTEGAQPKERAAFMQLASPFYYQHLQPAMGPRTRQALGQAASPQEWNTLLLSSPEFMHR